MSRKLNQSSVALDLKDKLVAYNEDALNARKLKNPSEIYY